MYRVIASFTDADKFRFIESVRKLNLLFELKLIVKTVIFCGKNNIPLRGKQDDNPDDSNPQGNFQALLEFRIDSSDVKLKEHLENAPRNATYRFKTIQDEIIETVGIIFLQRASRKLNKS